MTEDRLAALEALCREATEGPWNRGELESWHGGTGEPFRNVWEMHPTPTRPSSHKPARPFPHYWMRCGDCNTRTNAGAR